MLPAQAGRNSTPTGPPGWTSTGELKENRELRSSPSELRLQPLHREPAGAAGSTLLTASERGHAITVTSSGLLELFIISGTFRLPGGEVLGRHGYHCEVAAAPSLELHCEQPGSIMISHDGALAAS